MIKIIIIDYIESINGLKSVCPISVKSRRLSRNNAPRDQYTPAHKQCKNGLLNTENWFNYITFLIKYLVALLNQRPSYLSYLKMGFQCPNKFLFCLKKRRMTQTLHMAQTIEHMVINMSYIATYKIICFSNQSDKNSLF